jgi:hypothetical protein
VRDELALKLLLRLNPINPALGHLGFTIQVQELEALSLTPV